MMQLEAAYISVVWPLKLFTLLVRAVWIWGFHPESPKDMAMFMQAHYPKEMNAFKARAERFYKKYNIEGSEDDNDTI